MKGTRPLNNGEIRLLTALFPLILVSITEITNKWKKDLFWVILYH